VNLHAKLLEREAAGRPVRVVLIGAGKFGTMFLSQVRLTRGMHLVGVVDLNVARAKNQLKSAGWDANAYAAASLDDALTRGTTLVTDDADALIGAPQVDVVVEATGIPTAGIRHALKAIENGKHIVMVNVEADVVAGLAGGVRVRALLHARLGICPQGDVVWFLHASDEASGWPTRGFVRFGPVQMASRRGANAASGRLVGRRQAGVRRLRIR